jgi:hypothetical protein
MKTPAGDTGVFGADDQHGGIIRSPGTANSTGARPSTLKSGYPQLFGSCRGNGLDQRWIVVLDVADPRTTYHPHWIVDVYGFQ